MKVQKIIYGKSFEMYGYWEKINLEIEVEENETPEKVLDQAKYIVDQWHQANPASVYSGQNRRLPEARSTMTQETFIQQINATEDLKTLETFKLIADNYPDIKRAFDSKFYTLSK